MREVGLDAERYFAHAIPRGGGERFSELDGMRLDASATRHYHRVEKGFSLPAPKRPFGKRALPALNRVLANPNVDESKIYPAEARIILAALEQWNEHGVVTDVVAPRADTLVGNPLDAETTAAFITSRHSVRDFEARTVDRALISEAVRIASYAPSVCNRQSWRVCWIDEPSQVKSLLSIHSGSRGFAEGVPGVFIITYDIRAFEDTMERNQGWIDGGLYSMNLLLALHGLGLGAVPLNWSRRNSSTTKLRKMAKLPEHENVVMMIAAGYPAEGHRVARSARRPVSEILRFGM